MAPEVDGTRVPVIRTAEDWYTSGEKGWRAQTGILEVPRTRSVAVLLGEEVVLIPLQPGICESLAGLGSCVEVPARQGGVSCASGLWQRARSPSCKFSVEETIGFHEIMGAWNGVFIYHSNQPKSLKGTLKTFR